MQKKNPERKVWDINNLPILFFILSVLLYINIDKLPLSNPGNLKAADPIGHSLVSEGIINTQQWNYYDIVFSAGQDKAVNSQPPLYYLNVAMISGLSGLPSWVVFYFLICISQAFLIILVYLISYEIFENKKVSIIASMFSALPLPLYVWLYGLYIGFWLQVPSNIFMMLFLWLFIRFWKKNEVWTLPFLGLSCASIMTLHPQDLALVLIPFSLVVYRIISQGIGQGKLLFKNLLVLGIFPFLVLLPLIPRFLFVWGGSGGDQFKLGFYGIRSAFFTREYSGGLVYPDIFFIPLLVLLLFIFGFIFLALNYKKYRLWIFSSLYFLFIFYGAPLIFYNPYYFVRTRALTPFILYPTISYALYVILISLIDYFKLKNENKRLLWYLSMASVATLLVVSAIPDYKMLLSRTAYEHISLQEWNAYRWIQDNTAKEEKVLFFGAVFQHEFIYAKRISAVIDMDEYQRLVNEYLSTNITPSDFNVGWGGVTTRGFHKYEISFLEYKNFSEPPEKVNLSLFDYVFFQDLNEQIANVNHFFANEYITKYGFRPVYNHEGYIIIKNENKNQG